MLTNMTEGFPGENVSKMSSGEPGEKSWSPDSGLPPPFTPEYIYNGPLPTPIAGAPRYEQSSEMKERAIQAPELLDGQTASKKFLADERIQLAQEIRAERQRSRDQLALLALKAKMLRPQLENQNAKWEAANAEYEQLLDMRAMEANSITGRVRASIQKITGYEFEKNADLRDFLEKKEEENSGLELAISGLREELVSVDMLISGDTSLNDIKQKLKEHYAKADSIGKEYFDTQGRSIENVMRRNNAFVVHVIAEGDAIRHNDNSNVLREVSYEDDVDIMLALEPSVSASSVQSGVKSRLWPGSSGFILGGGQIGEAGGSDIGTQAEGIKKRGRQNSTLEKIDEVIGRNTATDKDIYEKYGNMGMNEVVVNNPEVFGFFQDASQDEGGTFWIGGDEIRNQASVAAKEGSYAGRKDSYTSILRRNIDGYRRRFAVAQERGLPVYVLTPEREIYECLKINNDGTTEIGKQLTPEEVAIGRAGLPPEKRKVLGENLLKKRLFKNEKIQAEAEEIIHSLS